MKLLEDVPSTLTQRPPQRRVRVTLAVMVGFLLVATVIGAILIAQSSGDTGSVPDRGAAEDSDIALADWANTAADTCLATATEHPALTQPPTAADAAAIHAGVAALASALNDQTPPSDDAERTQVTALLQLADQAEASWATLADASGTTNDQLSAATQAARALVDGLIGLGANCSSLVPE